MRQKPLHLEVLKIFNQINASAKLLKQFLKIFSKKNTLKKLANKFLKRKNDVCTRCLCSKEGKKGGGI